MSVTMLFDLKLRLHLTEKLIPLTVLEISIFSTELVTYFIILSNFID